MTVSVQSVSFRGDLIYKDRYIPHKQDITHDVIRADLEEKFGQYFYYLDQIAKEREMLVKPAFVARKKTVSKPIKRMQNNVDERILQYTNIPSFAERRKNDLYSGCQLVSMPDKLDLLKRAGIKSVFSLVPSDEYKHKVEELGLKYFSLKQAGLSIFDINGDLIKDLINKPSSYVNEQKDPKIDGLKYFIKTFNGENPQMPLPIYFGCDYGTDRTIFWFSLYNILKDEDMSKPLSDAVVQELAEFAKDTDDYFRW